MSQSIKNGLKILIRSLLVCGFLFGISMKDNKPVQMKTITKNNMTVSWEYKNDRIHFAMKAPAEGWVAIGFNTEENITGTYLLMGNVIAGVPDVIEYYTINPGNYRPVTALGGKSGVDHVAGEEYNGNTSLKFSLPLRSKTGYGRLLTEGTSYVMVLAYSLEDDFQHHSIMRTSIKIKL
ncbi:DOMON domain-containing protein [Fulvivirgaceae bacterium BMA12]|uniref:DOMON domain-containing protein n=1 Tax=Agaribacillus aureus TaxID=3051825 RepID=A0ABT8LAK7_9BACT|nr:DOMON domain-containing protein [Fulvivirgaceae bacterium BMA12]